MLAAAVRTATESSGMLPLTSHFSITIRKKLGGQENENSRDMFLLIGWVYYPYQHIL